MDAHHKHEHAVRLVNFADWWNWIFSLRFTWLPRWLRMKVAQLSFFARRRAQAAHRKLLQERKLRGEDVSDDLTLKRIYERCTRESVNRVRCFHPRKRKSTKA